MVQAIITILSALWLGILTSVSPCPLATNIAAISFLAKKVNRPKAVLLAGLSYTLGRMAAYTLLGIIIVNSLISVPVIANFLQKYMNMILGPVLLVVGCFLLDLLKVNLAGFSLSDKKQKSLAAAGLKGAFALGIIFALSFCPLSAALFFGSLVPLSLKTNYGLLLPLVYGIGTGLPVLIFSFVIASGIMTIARWFHKMINFERYTRKITGIIFILAGLYYCWIYLVKVFFN